MDLHFQEKDRDSFCMLPSPLTVLAINLATDVDRMNKLRDQFSKLNNFRLVRLPGVDGSTLPVAPFIHMTVQRINNLGNMGCLLSHIKAWETVAKCDTWMLILEDDARVIRPELFADLKIPADADLVFVNRRNEPFSRVLQGSTCPIFLPVMELIHHYSNLSKGIKPAIGGDGYLLSASGGRKLTKAISKDKLLLSLPDWYLLRYSLKPEDLKGKIENTWWENFRGVNPSFGYPDLSWDVITSYCLVPSLIDIDPGVNSSRNRLNKVATSDKT